MRVVQICTSQITLIREGFMKSSMKSGNRKEYELVFSMHALSEKIARWTGKNESQTTAISGLTLFRRESPTGPINGLYEPSLCLVAQGSKRVLLGEDTYIYDSQNYLITSLHLPTIVQVTEASREKPYLGLKMTLDPKEISQMMLDNPIPPPRIQQSSRAMATGKMTQPLLEATHRLVDLLSAEEDIPFLAPIIQREILYRLLVGDQGMRLRQIALAGSQCHQIARTIEWIKNHFSEPFLVNDLAKEAGMSISTFHHHFRSMTSLSPLQYQKQLRLQEARRLMMTERLDAATAALHVGYESPSQFSREYSRMFGAPPLRDITNLRQIELFD